MRFLIDTHCWLWAFGSRELLNIEATSLIQNRENEILFSAACAWEIAVKYARGKLQLSEPPLTYIPGRMSRRPFLGLPIQQAHALQAALLPFHHKDPFDRLLVAQAQVEGLPIMTADADFLRYDVEVIWAGINKPRRSRKS